MIDRQLIDLSYPLTDNMMVYPGDSRPVFEWIGRVNSEGFNGTKFTMHLHTGTHIDAPYHQLEDGAPIDQLPLSRFIGRAVLFRFREEPRSQEVPLKAVVAAELPIREGDIFVLDTGIARHAETKGYYAQFPVPSDELCEWLVGKKIGVLASDTSTIDRIGEGVNKHRILLRAGIPLVENLCHLELLPEGKAFTMFLLPIHLPGREGALCRAAAFIDFVEL